MFLLPRSAHEPDDEDGSGSENERQEENVLPKEIEQSAYPARERDVLEGIGRTAAVAFVELAEHVTSPEDGGQSSSYAGL